MAIYRASGRMASRPRRKRGAACETEESALSVRFVNWPLRSCGARIIELCFADHRGPFELLPGAARQKDAGDIARWLKRIDAYLVRVIRAPLRRSARHRRRRGSSSTMSLPDAWLRANQRDPAPPSGSARRETDALQADQHAKRRGVSIARADSPRRARRSEARDRLRAIRCPRSWRRRLSCRAGPARCRAGGSWTLSLRRRARCPKPKRRRARPDDCRREAAAAVIRAAFAAQSRATTPPSSALRETTGFDRGQNRRRRRLRRLRAARRLVAVALWQIDGDALHDRAGLRAARGARAALEPAADRRLRSSGAIS